MMGVVVSVWDTKLSTADDKPFAEGLVISGLGTAIRTLIALFLLLTPPLAAQSSPTPDKGYILGAGDLIEVSVLGQPEFTTRAKVRADGSVALPFLNAVPVAGETPLTLATALTQRLVKGGYYMRPVVSIEIAGYASRYVVVLGEVGVPGLVPIDRPYHLSEIIARSGGLRETGADYVVLRREGATEAKFRYDRLGSGNTDDDPLVSAGDKIFVPPAPTFSIYGQVNAAGTFAMKAAMTLRTAIARAGGLRENGSEGRAKLIRAGKRVKFNRDTEIEAGDVIIIGERLI